MLGAQAAGNAPAAVRAGKLIVIGFMGGNVSADNLLHREALLAQELQQRYPLASGPRYLPTTTGRTRCVPCCGFWTRTADGRLSAGEKSAARIVIYGHSWGASETVTLARRLNELGIPVLLTIQVDSVEKSNEDDGSIPPNVREAVNFYQNPGADAWAQLDRSYGPKRTTILGNYKSSYREHPSPAPGFRGWRGRLCGRTSRSRTTHPCGRGSRR